MMYFYYICFCSVTNVISLTYCYDLLPNRLSVKLIGAYIMKVNLSSLSDSELAERYNLGERDALEEIYRRNWRNMYNHARKMLRDDDQAADLVHDIFVALHEKLGQLELKDTIGAFLNHWVKLSVMKLIRHEKIKTDYYTFAMNYVPTAQSTTEETILLRELEQRFEQELAALPTRMKEVFELSRKQNLSYREIAQKTNTSEGTVKKQVYYALKILKEKLTILVWFLLYVVIFLFW